MKRIKVISWFGLDFLVTDIKRFPKKNVYFVERFNLKYIVTRYECGDYYIKALNDTAQIRVRIIKIFPTWRYLP